MFLCRKEQCMKLEEKLKVALDESRLLILGAQVLFGFQFEGAFQEQFSALTSEQQLVHGIGTLLLLASIALLIAPSLHHQIVYDGESRSGALTTATLAAGGSLPPLILGLGASSFVVFGHVFGAGAGMAFALLFVVTGFTLLFGLGFAFKRKSAIMPPQEEPTPLKVKIEQMLTEARVLIPGAQALLGFQFVATLTKSFQELPEPMQSVHAAGLCAVALAAMLLMTPAAVHRIAFAGEDDDQFFRIGSRLVIVAALPLAIGIAADITVVFYKITHGYTSAGLAGALALAFLLVAWYVYPWWRRGGRAYSGLRRPVPE
jgi:hypothetical protein